MYHHVRLIERQDSCLDARGTVPCVRRNNGGTNPILLETTKNIVLSQQNCIVSRISSRLFR
jgi:hypothetical protein